MDSKMGLNPFKNIEKDVPHVLKNVPLVFLLMTVASSLRTTTRILLPDYVTFSELTYRSN